MQTVILDSPAAVGRYAAAHAAALLNETLARAERARLLLATGQSQLELLQDLVRRPVEWHRVDAFHLDEYEGIEQTHPASFRRYLKERVADIVPLEMHYIDPSSPLDLEHVSALVAGAPIDVALVGIGENGHIAFNDPPADLVSEQPYIVVALDAECRAQQVREGWFSSLELVPQTAVTMSVRTIMRSRAIVSAVPRAAKADAIRRLFAAGSPTPDLPASVLREHPACTLVLDRDSSALVDAETWRRCVVV